MSDMLARLAARAQESPVVLGRRIGYRFAPTADHQEAWPGEEAWLGEQRITRPNASVSLPQAGDVPDEPHPGPARPRAKAGLAEAGDMPAEWAAGRSARAPRTDASDTADAPLPVEPQASGRRFRTSTTGLDAASGEGAPITQAMAQRR